MVCVGRESPRCWPRVLVLLMLGPAQRPQKRLNCCNAASRCVKIDEYAPIRRRTASTRPSKGWNNVCGRCQGSSRPRKPCMRARLPILLKIAILILPNFGHLKFCRPLQTHMARFLLLSSPNNPGKRKFGQPLSGHHVQITQLVFRSVTKKSRK